MEWLLRWETLVFVAPLALGVALVAGLAFGLDSGDSDADHDVEGDSDGDAHGHGLFELLGVGRVPLSMLLLTLTLLFGAAGLATNAFLEPTLPGAFGFVSLGVAFVVSFVGTGRIARLVAKHAPTMETYRVQRTDLLGRAGHAIVELTGDDGFVQVKDHEGNVQQLRVRTAGAVLPRGAKIITVEYNREGDWYLVEPFDVEAPEGLEAGRCVSPAKAGIGSGT